MEWRPKYMFFSFLFITNLLSIMIFNLCVARILPVSLPIILHMRLPGAHLVHDLPDFEGAEVSTLRQYNSPRYKAVKPACHWKVRCENVWFWIGQKNRGGVTEQRHPEPIEPADWIRCHKILPGPGNHAQQPRIRVCCGFMECWLHDGWTFE